MPPIPHATERQLQLIAVLCKERGQEYAYALSEALLGRASDPLDVSDAEALIEWLKSQERVCVVDSSDIPEEFRSKV